MPIDLNNPMLQGLLGSGLAGQAGVSSRPTGGLGQFLGGGLLSAPTMPAQQTYTPPQLSMSLADRVAAARSRMDQASATPEAAPVAPDPISGAGSGTSTTANGADFGTDYGYGAGGSPTGPVSDDGTVSTGVGGVSLSPSGEVTGNTVSVPVSQTLGGLLGMMTLGPPGAALGAGGGKSAAQALNQQAQSQATALTAALSDSNPDVNGAPVDGAPAATAGPTGTGGSAASAAAAAAAAATSAGMSAAAAGAASQAAADAVVSGNAAGAAAAGAAAAAAVDGGAGVSSGGAPSGPASASGPVGDGIAVGIGDVGAPSGDGGGCYLTTAAVEHLGLADDCDELQTLRAFRDRLKVRDAAAVSDYYRTAPGIVSAIKARPDAGAVWDRMWAEYVLPAVAAIKAGDDAKAGAIYSEGARWAQGVSRGAA